MAAARRPGKQPQTAEVELQPGKTAHGLQILTPTAAALPMVLEVARQPGKPLVVRRRPTLALAQAAPTPSQPAPRRPHTVAATHGAPKRLPTSARPRTIVTAETLEADGVIHMMLLRLARRLLRLRLED
jgi:hypothetical protein